MRPRIVDWLNATLGTSALGWLVPSPAVVYGVAALVVMVLFVKRCRSGGGSCRIMHSVPPSGG